MKQLKSFDELARALEQSVARLPADIAVVMEKSALAVEATAKAEIGTYQREDMGPFDPWPDLKAATVAEKRAHGYAEEGHDNPLLRTGHMRDSITHDATPQSFTVGSPDPVMEYQELGTATIPPRPVLGPALHRNIPTILNTVGAVIEENIAGET